ncbi:MAG: phosphoribosyltransferase [Candidatus Nanohalobium sp.]
MSVSGKTIDELLDQVEASYREDNPERRVQALNSIAQVAFDNAYDTGEDSSAVAFTEEAFAPKIQAFYGEKNNEVDLDRWREEFSDIEGESGVFHIPATGSAPYEYLRSCFSVLEEEYDQVVGVHSGGLAPLYAVEDLYDGDSVVLRYSHRDRDDQAVQITPEMSERADFQDSDVLILDDVVESGETLRKTGEYILDEGANSVDAIPVRTSMWDMSHDIEMLDLKEGGVKYRIVDYEQKKDYENEGLSLVQQ